MPAFLEPSNPQSPRYDKPVPRPPKSPNKTRDVRAHNRRREFLIRNPGYFQTTEHQLADPLLYDTLVRKFQTPAEREAESRAKGYSRVLEESLLRGEARLADLKSSVDGGAASSTEPAKDFTTESDLSKTQTKEEGLERWVEFLTERFVHGHDDDFDYSQVDNDDDFDTMERRDAEDAWFDEEDPGWASDTEDTHTARPETRKQKQGETGIQDF
ncbi:coiled-coil domain-containing protein [Colletotrichum karsti]|uniref:Coiled-coil domain-containing protein n=1 Tax=Colletotrichum karsti TaxID=1095194 RepID=A0A9P6HWF2_9PEZI|nr:coiled-coil domain-containing protein [Colletotrichum karsti]KAF9869526.1 coiled-coil domain-containing protein [Colletotrichum karsti]